jgi:hypothetical protein
MPAGLLSTGNPEVLGASSISPSWGSARTPGDLLFFTVWSTSAITVPAEYTSIFDGALGSIYVAVSYRVADDTADDEPAFALSPAANACGTRSWWTDTTGIDITDYATAAAEEDCDAPSVTPTYTDDVLFQIFMGYAPGAQAPVGPNLMFDFPPGGYSLVNQNVSHQAGSTHIDGTCSGYYLELPSAASTGVVTAPAVEAFGDTGLHERLGVSILLKSLAPISAGGWTVGSIRY